MQPFDAKHVVVTGGGRGIGAAIVREFAGLGAKVSMIGRDLARVHELSAKLCAEFKRDFFACDVDVSNAQSVAQAFKKSREALGPVHILVNNAGLAESGALHKTELEVWDRLIGVNLRGVFLCCKEVLPGMLALKDGSIINIASTAALRGYPYVAAYCASKHGVLGLTRALALEVSAAGLRVNAVCPGFTNTDLLKDSIRKVVLKSGRSEEEVRKEFLKDSPSGRFVEPQDVAKKVVWLCMTEQRVLNGQAIVVE